MTMIILISRIINHVYDGLFIGESINKIKSDFYFEYATYLYDVSNNMEKAIAYYNKALSFNPNDSFAYGGLAAAFFE
jgi:tetratricopeptide (TPR) repeat protein